MGLYDDAFPSNHDEAPLITILLSIDWAVKLTSLSISDMAYGSRYVKPLVYKLQIICSLALRIIRISHLNHAFELEREKCVVVDSTTAAALSRRMQAVV
jgi:hypothetical protein